MLSIIKLFLLAILLTGCMDTSIVQVVEQYEHEVTITDVEICEKGELEEGYERSYYYHHPGFNVKRYEIYREEFENGKLNNVSLYSGVNFYADEGWKLYANCTEDGINIYVRRFVIRFSSYE